MGRQQHEDGVRCTAVGFEHPLVEEAYPDAAVSVSCTLALHIVTVRSTGDGREPHDREVRLGGSAPSIYNATATVIICTSHTSPTVENYPYNKPC